MKHARQSHRAQPEQPPRHDHGVTRLADLPDVLTISETLAVLRMRKSTYYNLQAHRAFPIKPLKGVAGVKYAKVALVRLLERSAV